MITNIAIIKKGSGGNDAMLQGDFALEPSENFKPIFFRTDFVDFHFKRVQLSHLFIYFLSHFVWIMTSNVNYTVRTIFMTHFASAS